MRMLSSIKENEMTRSRKNSFCILYGFFWPRGAASARHYMAQRQDFSLQGRTSTQTASQRGEQEAENVERGEDRRLQATVIKFNWFNQDGVFTRDRHISPGRWTYNSRAAASTVSLYLATISSTCSGVAATGSFSSSQKTPNHHASERK